MNKPKFSIDDEVFYIESSTFFNKQIKCPMCFGKRKIVIILGDESRQESECGYCDRGIERSTGIATVNEPHALVRTGRIKGVFSETGWRYKIDHSTLDELELYSDREKADRACASELVRVTELANKWFIDSFVTAKKKQIWSVGYHRARIKDAERTLSWHKTRLCMINERKEVAAK